MHIELCRAILETLCEIDEMEVYDCDPPRVIRIKERFKRELNLFRIHTNKQRGYYEKLIRDRQRTDLQSILLRQRRLHNLSIGSSLPEYRESQCMPEFKKWESESEVPIREVMADNCSENISRGKRIINVGKLSKLDEERCKLNTSATALPMLHSNLSQSLIHASFHPISLKSPRKLSCKSFPAPQPNNRISEILKSSFRIQRRRDQQFHQQCLCR